MERVVRTGNKTETTAYTSSCGVQLSLTEKVVRTGNNIEAQKAGTSSRDSQFYCILQASCASASPRQREGVRTLAASSNMYLTLAVVMLRRHSSAFSVRSPVFATNICDNFRGDIDYIYEMRVQKKSGRLALHTTYVCKSSTSTYMSTFSTRFRTPSSSLGGQQGSSNLKAIAGNLCSLFSLSFVQRVPEGFSSRLQCGILRENLKFLFIIIWACRKSEHGQRREKKCPNHFVDVALDRELHRYAQTMLTYAGQHE